MTQPLTDDLKQTARHSAAGLFHHAPTRTDGSSVLPLGRLLSAIFRAKKLIFFTTGVGVALAAFMAIKKPNTYASTGSFLFSGSGSEAITLSPGKNINVKDQELSSNAAFVFTSPTLLKRVVERVTPKELLQPYRPGNPEEFGEGFGEWMQSIFHSLQRQLNPEPSADELEFDVAMKQLAGNLLVDKPRTSDVLLCQYSANSPELAQKILSIYMEEARTWHVEVYNQDEEFKVIDENATAALKARGEANDALETFLTGKGVRDFAGALAERKEDELEANRAHSKASKLVATNGQKITSLQGELKTIDQFETINTKQPEKNVELEALEVELGSLAVERAGEASQYREGSPKLARIDERTRQLREEIKRVRARKMPVVELEVTRKSERYSSTEAMINELSSELIAARSSIETLKTAKSDAAARYDELAKDATQWRRLNREDAESSTRLLSAETELARAQNKRTLSMGGLSSLKEVNGASLPIDKEGPNRGKFLMFGFFGGLFLGLGWVVTRTLPDTTVRRREDLEALVDLPILGTMPKLDGSNIRRHQSLRELGA